MNQSPPIPIVVPPHKEGALRRRHPWVLHKSIIAPTLEPELGAVVDLVTSRGEWLGRGLYNPQSRIRVRVYAWQGEESLDEAFFRRRLEHALELRRMLNLLGEQGGSRLVFSEGDHLSGLIVDRYAGAVIVQVTAAVMLPFLPLVSETLQQALAVEQIGLRIDPQIARAEGIDPREQWLLGGAGEEPLVMDEHGVRLAVDLQSGQKTGAYLDQRDNHRAAAAYMAGRRVLDICTYAGGFALAAAKLGGAREVIGVDSSEAALALAQQNKQLNALENVHFEKDGCFERLAALREQGEEFDAVILDPPRFASTRRDIDRALRAYFRLNRLAVEILAPGGVLVTCSCSSHVTREAFERMLAGVSQKTGRSMQLLETRGAGPDHPVLLTCPETAYLKCFICRVS